MYRDWLRVQVTTAGSDPTVVVEWHYQGSYITEFQNVYVGTGIFEKVSELVLMMLHTLLEHVWWQELVNSGTYDEH